MNHEMKNESIITECQGLVHNVISVIKIAEGINSTLLTGKITQTIILNYFILDLNQLLVDCEILLSKVSSNNKCGQFEWVDSILVTAIKSGYWLSITHANFCRYTTFYLV